MSGRYWRLACHFRASPPAFFCPSMKQPEILALKEHYPDLYRRAVAMEDRAMPYLTSVKGLGRNYAWRERFGAADRRPGPC